MMSFRRRAFACSRSWWMLAAFASGFSGILAGSASAGVFDGMTPKQRRYLESRIFVVSTAPQRAELPSSVINTKHLPAVTSQGQAGTCGAYGITYYYKTWQEARERGWTRPNPAVNPERCASPAYSYDLLRHGPQSGASPLEVAQHMVDFGACNWQDMPYDDTSVGSRNWPPADKWRAAMPWRAQAAGIIPKLDQKAGRRALKAHLAGGDLASTAMTASQNLHDYPEGKLTSNNVIYACDTDGGVIDHALTIIGYDDNREYLDEEAGILRRGAFLAVNSWGTGWGIREPTVGTRGFCWLAYQLFDNGGGWPEAVVMRDRRTYNPEFVVELGVAHTEAKLFGTLTTSGRGDHGIQLFPGLNMAPHPTDQSIWIDVSDLLDYGRAGFTLDIRDFSEEAGTLDPLRIESWDGTHALASLSAPVPTVDNNTDPSPVTLYVGRYQQRLDMGAADDLRQGSAAWADADGDGDLDLLIAGGFGGESFERKTLYARNDGEAGFTVLDPGMIAGDSAAWIDIDNDGDVDAIVSASDRIPDSANQTVVYRNDGGATFTALAQTLPAANAGALAVGDFDNDGRMDLCIGNDGETAVWLNRGGGSFSKRTAGLPALGAYADGYAIRAADLNGDHRLDLVLSGIGDDEATRAYLNQGVPLRFSPAPGTLPDVRFPALALADADLDGDLDLVMSGCRGDRQMQLFRNDGAGGFRATETSLPQLRAGNLAWADVNADGRPDLLATGREEEVWGAYPDRYYKNDTLVLTQNADGDFEQFGPPLPDVSRGVANFADVNGDGNPDILVGGTLAQIYEVASDKLTLGVYLHGDTKPGWFDGNTAPNAPTSLNAEHDGHGRVTFTWSGAADAETPEAGLRYQLRCGTTSGGHDVFSGVHLPGTPAAFQRSGHFLDHVPVGTLYWQVRTVDSAGICSSWSAEEQAAVDTYTHPQYLAVDGNAAYEGAVDPAPGTYPHDRGDVVSLTATPAAGYAFSEWQGDIDGVADPAAANTTVTLDADRQLTAVFRRIADPARPAWTLAADGVSGYYATQQHTLEFFDGYLLRMGGQTSSWALQNLVYASNDDGQTWRQLWQVAWNDHEIEFSVPWPARAGHCSEVFNGKLWVFAGEGAEDFLADVWRASDVFTWERVTDAAPWGRRINAGSAVFDDKLWILGGEKFAGGGNPLDRFSDVWSSADGENWTQVTDNAPWPAGTVEATTFNGSLIVLARSEVWQSADGENWNALTLDAPFGQLLDTCLEAFNGKLVVVGGYDNTTWQRSDQTWTSLDGVNWSEIAPDPDSHWSARSHTASCVEGDRLWLVGGKQADGDIADDAWYLGAGELPDTMGRLRLFVEPLAGGRIKPPGNTSYVDDLGTDFSLVANPAIGYAFDHWEGPVADPDSAETTVALERDTEVTAHFTTTNTALAITFQPDIRVGGVSVSPGTSDREWDWEADTITYMHPRGAELTVQATPKFGYVFDHWEGDLSGTSGTADLVLDEPRNITAVFVEDPILSTGTLACSDTWAAVIKADGTAWAAGTNDNRQQGHALAPDQPGEFWPVAIASNVRQLFLAKNGGLGITSNGDLLGWGPAWGGLADYELAAHPVLTSLDSGIRGCAGAFGLTTDRNLYFFDRYGKLFDSVNRSVDLGFDSDLGDIVALAEGPNTVFAVTRDGKLYGWGENAVGQLGLGDSLPTHERPQRVRTGGGVRRVACGHDPVRVFTLALLDDLTVASWGDNSRGQLGRTVDESTPTALSAAVPELANIVKISAGDGHGLALDQNGNLHAWGDNTFAQLGTGDFDDAAAPVPVATDIADIAAGPLYTLVRRTDGAFAWCGQVPGRDQPLMTLTEIPGLAYDDPSLTLEVAVEPSGIGEFSPRAGRSHIAANRSIPLHAEDTERYEFVHWSENVDDPLGADTALTTSTSTSISVHYRYQAEAAARLAIGAGTGGQVNPADGTHEYEPGTVVTVRADADTGYRFQRWQGPVSDPRSRTTTIIMDRDQSVLANFAELRLEPQPQISTGRNNVMEYDGLTLDSEGKVYDYGATASGSPIPLNGEGDLLENVVALAVGSSHQLALSQDGAVWAWGDNTQGQCGTGDVETDSCGFPQTVLADNVVLQGISRIAAGAQFSLALDPNGFLYSWGNNTRGQLGHSPEADTVPSANPVRDADGDALTDVRAIACGAEFALAALADGTVRGWGNNDAGQLGFIARRGEAIPQAVPRVPAAVNVAAGGACAGMISAEGEVWTWGDNTYGQLGHGTTGGAETPARVNGLPPIVSLAAGPEHMLALDENGTVWAWGRGEMGRLGNGALADSNTPVQVLDPARSAPLSGIQAVAAHAHSYAINSGGRLLQWGYDRNSFGEPDPVSLPWDRLGLGQPDGDGLCALSLSSFPEEGGSVHPNEGLVFVNRGTLVEIQAQPSAGYRFLGWGGDLSGTLATATVRMRDDLAAVAYYELAGPRLRLAPLRMTPGQTSHLEVFLDGESAPLEGVQLELAAPDGFSFGPASYGLNNGPNSELSQTVPEPTRTMAVLVDTDDQAGLLVDGDLPLMSFEIIAEPDCAPGTYTVELSDRTAHTPVVAYADGHLWQRAETEVASVTVDPTQGLVLRLVAAPADSDTDILTTRPAGPSSLRADRDFNVELWLQDRRANGQPVAAAQLDLLLPASLTAVEVNGTEATSAVSGVVNGGTVSDFGGSLAEGAVSLGDWTCVARLRVAPTTAGQASLSIADAAIRLDDDTVLTEPAIALQPGNALDVTFRDNAAPAAQPGPAVSVRWAGQVSGMLGGADDNPDDRLSYTLVDQPEHGEIIAFDAETGAFTYQPHLAYNGPDRFSYTVSDGTLTSDPADQALFVSRGWTATLRRGAGWCVFGQDEEASEDLDTVDLSADSAATVGFEAPDSSGLLQRDLRARDDAPVWRLRAAPAPEITKLEWDSRAIPGGMHLVRVSPKSAVPVLVDMRDRSRLDLAPGVVHEFDLAMPEGYALPLGSGWNLIAFPGTPVRNEVAGVFADSADEQVQVYEWENGVYNRPSHLRAYRGYWVRTEGKTTRNLSLIPAFVAEFQLEKGWNLLGVPYPAALPVVSGLFPAAWRFDGERYERATRLLPGTAYWVFAYEPAAITFAEEISQ